MKNEDFEAVVLNLPVSGVWQGLDFVTGERRFLAAISQPGGEENVLDITEEVHDGLVEAFLRTPQAQVVMGETAAEAPQGESVEGDAEDADPGDDSDQVPDGDDDGFGPLEGGSEF